MAYPIPAKSVQIEYQVKRSRFLCSIEHCASRKAAENFIQRISTQYSDANHNCWAMIAGPPSDPGGYGMSDDGEPRGCAGKPMFNVLQHSGIGEIAVVVSRWFGGIKLGTGGMARAYSSSVQQGLASLTTIDKIFYGRYSLTLPYDLQSTVEYILEHTNGQICGQHYDQLVSLEVEIPKETEARFLQEITEKGRGRIVCSEDK